MAATKGLPAFGTKFMRGDGTLPTEVFTEVAEVKDIDGPSISRNTHDATHHGSPGGYSEFIGGLRDGGEVSFTMNFVPSDTGYQDMRSDFDDNAAHNYRIIFPDAGAETVTFAGLITDMSYSAPVDGLLETEITIKLAGIPTWS